MALASLRSVSTGFSWGYADLVSTSGDGIVVIWGYALPFSPRVTADRLAGLEVVPADRPCVSVAVYEAGRTVFYTLQSAEPSGDADPYAGSVVVGGLQVHRREGGLQLTLNLPIPGSEPLLGEITLTGVEVAPQREASVQERHRWSPRLLGSGSATLSCGTWSYACSGRAYHDGNASTVGLDELGITRWSWGRVPVSDGDWIYYLVEGAHPVNLLLFIQPDGVIVEHPVVPSMLSTRRGRWGLTAPDRLAVNGMEVKLEHFVEDGPFYQRAISRVVLADGTVVEGVSEFVEVAAMGRLPFLTTMADFDPARPGLFVALFNGPSAGAARRWIRDIWGRLWSR